MFIYTFKWQSPSKRTSANRGHNSRFVLDSRQLSKLWYLSWVKARYGTYSYSRWAPGKKWPLINHVYLHELLLNLQVMRVIDEEQLLVKLFAQVCIKLKISMIAFFQDHVWQYMSLPDIWNWPLFLFEIDLFILPAPVQYLINKFVFQADFSFFLFKVLMQKQFESAMIIYLWKEVYPQCALLTWGHIDPCN